MRKLALGLIATGLIVGMSLANASTCSLQGTAVPASQVKSSLQGLGYTPSKTVTMNNCVYQVKAKDQSNKKWTLYFDPLTGNMIGKMPLGREHRATCVKV